MKTSIGIAAIAALAGSAIAGTSYDANVTNNVIFGAGNANGGFTVVRNDTAGIEIGLRAKLRYDANGQPQNQFNSNGDGTYTFGSHTAALSQFNYEWSVNTNHNGNGTNLFDVNGDPSYQYRILIDYNPAEGNSDLSEFLVFDPIATNPLVPFWDHSIGDNTTDQGQGSEATNAAEYASLASGNNMAQNSWNMGFFSAFHPNPFDGLALGEYEIRFEVFELGVDPLVADALAGNSIFINVVPMPAASAMAGVGLLALGARRRR